MINPDGVVLGNYRTGLTGRDFNREFIDPDRTWFVEVNELKTYLQRCKWVYQKNFEFF
jgi:murein tripeptide amidase MpaA